MRTVVQLLLLQVRDQVRVLRGSAGVDACRCSLNALAQEGVLGVDFAAAARPACRAARIAHAHVWPTKQHAHTVSERVRRSGRVGAGAHSVRRSLVGVEASEDPCPRGVLALRLVALPPPNESGFISCNLFCIAAMRRSISLHLSDKTGVG